MSLFRNSTTRKKKKSPKKKRSRSRTRGKGRSLQGARPWLIGIALVVIVGGVGVVKWSRTGSGQATLLTLGSDKMFSEVQTTVEAGLAEALPTFRPGPADAASDRTGKRAFDHDWPADQLGPGAAVRCRAVSVSGEGSWWAVQTKVAEALRSRGARVLWGERLYPTRRVPADQTRPNEMKDYLRLDVGVPGRPTHTLVLYREELKPDVRWGAGASSTAWSRFAAADGPVVALLIDDWGYSKSDAAKAILSVPAPLTLAVLPGLSYSRHFALKGTELVLPAGAERDAGDVSDSSARARRQRMAAGCFVEVSTGSRDTSIPAKRREIMLHLPMEPQGYPDPDPGPKAVMVGMDAKQIGTRIDEAMQALPMITGVNNHMGSAATSDPATMEALMKALAARDLMFIDSLTSANSVAYTSAQEAGLPTARNRIFLDYDNENRDAIRKNLEALVRSARATGFALGIGHPHRATAEVLVRELPRLMEQGVRFVTVSEMLALRDRARAVSAGG